MDEYGAVVVGGVDVRGCADCKELMVPVLILPLGVVAAVALSLGVIGVMMTSTIAVVL